MTIFINTDIITIMIFIIIAIIIFIIYNTVSRKIFKLTPKLHMRIKAVVWLNIASDWHR